MTKLIKDVDALLKNEVLTLQNKYQLVPLSWAESNLLIV